jgi:phytoene synthase
VELAARARQRFAEARRLLTLCDRRKLRPARIMLETYARLLDRLARRGWEHRGDRRLRLSALEKAWIGLRYGLF